MLSRRAAYCFRNDFDMVCIISVAFVAPTTIIASAKLRKFLPFNAVGIRVLYKWPKWDDDIIKDVVRIKDIVIANTLRLLFNG